MDAKRMEELDTLTQKAFEDYLAAETDEDRLSALERYEKLFKLQDQHYKVEAEAYNLDETRRILEDKNATDAQIAELKLQLDQQKAAAEDEDRKASRRIKWWEVVLGVVGTFGGAIAIDALKSKRQKEVLEYEKEDVITTKAFERPY